MTLEWSTISASGGQTDAVGWSATFWMGVAVLYGGEAATHNASLSEGSAPAVVVGDLPETPYKTRDNTDFLRLLRQSEARLPLACFPLARRSGAPNERGVGGESAPLRF